MFTDNSKEFIKACQDLTARRVKEGTAIAIVQTCACDQLVCYCYLRNVHDLMADGKTAYEKKIGVNFDGS